MCPLIAPVLIVNKLLFFFFFFCCGHLQNYWSKQGRRYAPLSSLYYLDVYGSHTTKNTTSDLLVRAAKKVLLTFPRPRLSYKPSKVRIVPLADWTPSSSIFFYRRKKFCNTGARFQPDPKCPTRIEVVLTPSNRPMVNATSHFSLQLKFFLNKLECFRKYFLLNLKFMGLPVAGVNNRKITRLVYSRKANVVVAFKRYGIVQAVRVEAYIATLVN